MPEHEVQSGDCIASIAFAYGFFPDTIWNHADNAELKSRRKDPNVLAPGDVVAIPEKSIKQESRGTESRHTFKRKGVPAELNVRFEIDGKSCANIPFTLQVDGVPKEGALDAQGWLREPISPAARTAKVILRLTSERREEYVLNLGGVNPTDLVSGHKTRLRNLGLFTGDINEEPTMEYREALRAFQEKQGLPPTGEMDEALAQALKDAHYS